MEQPPQVPPQMPPQMPPPQPATPPTMPGTQQSPPTIAQQPTAPPPAPAQAPPPAAAAPPPAPPKKRKGWVIALVAFLLLALLSCCCGGGAFYYFIQKQAKAQASLKAAVVKAAEAELAFEPVDKLVTADFKDLGSADVGGASAKVDAGEKTLAQAQRDVAQAKTDLTGEDRALAVLAETLMRRQLEAIQQARTILQTVDAAAKALGPSKQAWAAMKEERRLSGKSIDSYNKHTKPGTRTAISLLKQARAKIESAQKSYAAAVGAFPQGRFGDYRKYASMRLTHNDLMQRTAVSYLGGNTSGTNRLVDQVNTDSKRVNKLYLALPAPEGTRPVTDGLKAEVKSVAEAYTALRQQISSLAEQLSAKARASSGGSSSQ